MKNLTRITRDWLRRLKIEGQVLLNTDMSDDRQTKILFLAEVEELFKELELKSWDATKIGLHVHGALIALNAIDNHLTSFEPFELEHTGGSYHLLLTNAQELEMVEHPNNAPPGVIGYLKKKRPKQSLKH